MIKKINVLIFLLCILVIPQSALAADSTYGYYGTTSSTKSTPLYANSSNGDAAHWFDVSVAGSGTGYVVWGMNDGSGNLVEMSRNEVPANVVEPSGSGAIAFWLESTGGEIHATVGHTNNDNNLTVYFTSDGSGGSNGGSDCIGCDLFDCPGWTQYMGKINQIISAIPPAPNWQTVADTFRDTIAPRIKSDLDDLLGRAPDPPPAPEAPSIPPTPSAPPLPAAPALPSDLDDRGLTDPTGKEDQALDDSTFDSSDIKDEAPVIQEREDPTGGFSITDPVSGLPSQDEFMENLPNEGSAALPDNPEEGANVAPTPEDTTGSAPLPGDTGDTAPLPTEGSDTGPIPHESGTAPIPTPSVDIPPIP